MTNKKGVDGKQRILSIIADDFKYDDLQKQRIEHLNQAIEVGLTQLKSESKPLQSLTYS